MRELYIELMAQTLSAYSREHIERYFDEVKTEGLTEHGFPRLTSNIGILLSHGRCPELKSLFLEMMDFCCTEIPRVRAANDFSVREVVCCIRECETAGIVDSERIKFWKSELAKIDPYTCYNVYATSAESDVKNWALFTGVSEFYRLSAGIGGDIEFIETQSASQFKWIDDCGMYMDARGDIHHPMVYDLVARGLFVMLLNEGYRGRYYYDIDLLLRRAALFDLKMQSPNGEIPYGGRSNQFLHNEPWLCAVLEYEAKRYAETGETVLADEFRSAIRRALCVTEKWLERRPLYHIKNRYPIDTRFGCEGYAYFDKYMITVASNLYAAYSACDGRENIPAKPDIKPSVFATTEHFHKMFLKAGGYGIEIDINADPHYDCSGVGRVHKADAPSTVCMSVPCPSSGASYTIPDGMSPLSICVGATVGGKSVYATDEKVKYDPTELYCDKNASFAKISCLFEDEQEIISEYKVDATGVQIKLSGDGRVALMLPAFYFDGESYTKISSDKNTLSVSYGGYVCRYKTSGEILPLDISGANRNGLYKAFCATAERTLDVKIEIEKENI